MNIFTFSSGALTAVLAAVLIFFAATYLLNRSPDRVVKGANAATLALALLFCIETFWITINIVPPIEQVKSDGETIQVVSDWMSAASLSMGDLYLAWVLVLLAAGTVFFFNKSLHANPRAPGFYDKFSVSMPLAVLLTSVFYIFVAIPGYFEQGVAIYEKILFRGLIPYLIIGLFFWVLLNAVFLAAVHISQRRHDQQITSQLQGPESRAPAQTQGKNTSVLMHRFSEIQHFMPRTTRELPEFSQMVEQQSGTERDAIDLSILYLHTAMWAMPVLGFLGTVWGIAEAVANLIPLLEGLSASELGGDQLALSLAGLGVAFDTTLVALALSLPAMMVVSVIEKVATEGVLARDQVILQQAKDLASASSHG